MLFWSILASIYLEILWKNQNSVNDLFVTFKVGQGQLKAFQQRSMGHATLMLYYVKIRLVVLQESR
jgi:hypothetical protein